MWENKCFPIRINLLIITVAKPLKHARIAFLTGRRINFQKVLKVLKVVDVKGLFGYTMW